MPNRINKPIIISAILILFSLMFFGCSDFDKPNPTGASEPIPAHLENLLLENIQIADFNGSNGHARNSSEEEIRINPPGSKRSYAIVVDNSTPSAPEIKIVEVTQ